MFHHNSFICLYLPDRLLTFDVFDILKLLLTNLVCVPPVIVSHDWVTGLVAYVFTLHLACPWSLANFHPIWIFYWCRGAVGRLLDGWLLAIDLACLLSSSVQERGAWVLLISIIRHIILTLSRKVQSLCLGQAHAHLVWCSHSKSIVIVVLGGFRQLVNFSRVVLKFMSLHNDKSVYGKCAFFLKFRYRVSIHLLFDKTNYEFYLLFLYGIILIKIYQLIQWLLLLIDYVVIILHYFYCFLVLILIVLPYISHGCRVVVHQHLVKFRLFVI